VRWYKAAGTGNHLVLVDEPQAWMLLGRFRLSRRLYGQVGQRSSIAPSEGHRLRLLFGEPEEAVRRSCAERPDRFDRDSLRRGNRGCASPFFLSPASPTRSRRRSRRRAEGERQGAGRLGFSFRGRKSRPAATVRSRPMRGATRVRSSRSYRCKPHSALDAVTVLARSRGRSRSCQYRLRDRDGEPPPPTHLSSRCAVQTADSCR